MLGFSQKRSVHVYIHISMLSYIYIYVSMLIYIHTPYTYMYIYIYEPGAAGPPSPPMAPPQWLVFLVFNDGGFLFEILRKSQYQN